MMPAGRLFFGVVLIAGGLMKACPAEAGTFRVTILNVPGETDTVATAINDHDEVAGSYLFNGFTWSDGVYTKITTDGTQIVALNRSGDGAETSSIDGKTVASAYDGATGQLSIIPTKPQYSAYAAGINKKGTIVGMAFTHKYFFGFRYAGHQLFLLRGPAGSHATQAVGISDAGVVAGNTYDLSRQGQAFTYQQKIYTALTVPGATQTISSFITGDGVVGGWYNDSSGYHSFTQTGGVLARFSYPGGAQDTYVTGADPNGELVGYYQVGYNTPMLGSSRSPAPITRSTSPARRVSTSAASTNAVRWLVTSPILAGSITVSSRNARWTSVPVHGGLRIWPSCLKSAKI